MIEIEAREPAGALLDDHLVLRARGAGEQRLIWRARYRDDDGRVWRAVGADPAELECAWTPAKATGDGTAALASLRAVRVDVHVEAGDGRSASRTLTRLIAAPGVRSRRWRDGVAATLHRPEGEPCATVLLDARAGAGHAITAALLASRGVLVLAAGGDLEAARARLADVPGAGDPVVLGAGLAPVPNVGVRGDDPAAAVARAAAWDALLATLGARPRAASGAVTRG